LETFVGETRNNFPRRQKGERVVLVPGDPVLVDIAIEIYRLRYSDAWSMQGISEKLESEMKPASSSFGWTDQLVRSILVNHAYTGVGVCCKFDTSVHAKRGKSGPVLFGTPRQKEEHAFNHDTLKKVRTLHRPVDEWLAVRIPTLLNFLPKSLRRLAKAENHRRRRRSSKGSIGVRNSSFFLTGIIRSMPLDAPMRGNPSNRPGKCYRHYATSSTDRKRCPKGSLARRTLAADVVEQAFLSLVSNTIRNDSVLRQRLIDVANRRVNRSDSQDCLGPLLSERKEREEHLRMILDLGPKARQLAAKKASELEARLEELDRLIAKERKPHEILRAEQVPILVARVMQQLEQLHAVLSGRSFRLLRRMARLMVDTIIFDTSTDTVTFNLRIPERWLFSPENVVASVWNRGVAGRTNTVIPYKNSLPIGSFGFRAIREGRRLVALDPIQLKAAA
jgi:hypothetical protein